jgi:hypothetical protein
MANIHILKTGPQMDQMFAILLLTVRLVIKLGMTKHDTMQLSSNGANED